MSELKFSVDTTIFIIELKRMQRNLNLVDKEINKFVFYENNPISLRHIRAPR